MENIIKLGKWFFLFAFLFFGLLHFGPLEYSLPYVPRWLPFRVFWVYFVGVCFILFVVSAIVKKYDRLAATLLGVCLLLFVLLIHIPDMVGGNFSSLIGAIRDIAMAGAAWMYAGAYTKEITVTKI